MKASRTREASRLRKTRTKQKQYSNEGWNLRQLPIAVLAVPRTVLGIQQTFNKYTVKKWVTALVHTLTALPPALPSNWSKSYQNSVCVGIGISSRTPNIHKPQMVGLGQWKVESKKKKISVMRKMSTNDTGKYASVINSQISWSRFSGLAHPRGIAAQSS